MTEINCKNPVTNGVHEMRRNEHVRVRLVPAHKGNPTQVKLTSAEKKALIVAATKLKYFVGGRGPGLSAFLRDLGKKASEQEHAALDVAEQIGNAANASGMVVGEWLRTIALASIGFTPLAKQIGDARKAYGAGEIGPDVGFEGDE